MKIKEREFKIFEGKRPRVLLLGNGVCRAFGGVSWNRLLDNIKNKEAYPLPAERYIMPMPLKAAMLTDNTLATKIRGLVEKRPLTGEDDINWTSFVKSTPEMEERIRKLILNNFDYVLTTNYSYEIEKSLYGMSNLSQEVISGLMDYHEVDNAQTQFLINTFNSVNGVPVWHIHGEARKPNSMIVGSYYYGKLLKRCVERLDGSIEQNKDKLKQVKTPVGKTQEFRKNIRGLKPQKIGSWVDAFVLGDVYILGLGMDFSEADLWWLIEYKHDNAKICGRTVFFEPQDNHDGACVVDIQTACEHSKNFVCDRRCKSLLLKACGVETLDYGFSANNSAEYRMFYDYVIDKMKMDNINRRFSSSV